MTTPQGTATFTGIDQMIEASISLVHGISPSVAQLTLVPQSDFTTETGTLTLAFGDVTITLTGCKVDLASVQRDSSGQVWRLSVYDRRWQWRFGQISGSYNLRRDDSSLRAGENGTINTVKTPQQLASLCLDAMGESGYDVGDLPNDSRPTIEWDYALPATELANLCDSLGCRVVLGTDNRVALRRVGTGAELDPTGALENSLTVNPPEVPDAIAVVGGVSRYQVDFPLEAVGLTEGNNSSSDVLVPINSLSYKPTGGWTHIDLPYFNQVKSQFRARAQKSVFKYYRIKTPCDVPGYVGPSGATITRLEQVLPIEDEQIEMAIENGAPANRTAVVFGVWYLDAYDVKNSVTAVAPLVEPVEGDDGVSLPIICDRPYTLDVARGLVIFEEAIYSNTNPSADGSPGMEVWIGEAQLHLRAACYVRDAASLALSRYTRTRSTGSALGTPTRFIENEDLRVGYTPTYADDYSLVSVSTNATAIDAVADVILDNAMMEYTSVVPQFVRYPGLVAISPDGAIQQVTFHVGGGGTTTSVSRNCELPRFAPGQAERRQLERQRELRRAQRRSSPRNLARTVKASPDTKPRPRT